LKIAYIKNVIYSCDAKLNSASLLKQKQRFNKSIYCHFWSI